MPTSTIISDNGVVSGTTGLKTAGGDDGTLILQTTTAGGTATTALTISNTQVTTLANALPAGSGGTGANTLTSENVIIGNGTSAVKFVAPGTTGNVLTSNGSAWLSQAAAAGGGDYIMQVFTTPGTWTKAAGLKAIRVTVIGGGGGASTNAPATGGGTSSFGSPAFLSATGGGRGTSPASGAGGAGSGGQLNSTGGSAFVPFVAQCIPYTGYYGGNGAFGFSPLTLNATAGGSYGGGGGGQIGPSNPESFNGGGGGGGAIEYIDAPALPGPQPYTVGAAGSAGTPNPGRNGAAGVVIVEEFY
jgi:hypothetical protein